MTLDLDDAQKKLILVALGRTRSGMPQPEVIDVIAGIIERDMDGRAGQMYEMAQGAPMGGRSTLIKKLVDGMTLTPPEPLTLSTVLHAAHLAANREALRGYFAGSYEQTDGELPMVRSERDGPRLEWFLQNFNRIQELFTERTGIPSSWVVWSHDAQWLEDERDRHDHLVCHDEAAGPFRLDVRRSRWRAEIIDRGRVKPVAGHYELVEPLYEYWVEVGPATPTDSRLPKLVEVSDMHSSEVDGPEDVVEQLAEQLAQNTAAALRDDHTEGTP